MLGDFFKRGDFSPSDTKQDPVGYWAQKPFCVPHVLNTGNRLNSASKTFPEFQGADSSSC